MSDRSPVEIAERVDSATFDAWYDERRRRENARSGAFYRNVPTDPPPEDVLFPSSLLSCHRKQYYRERDAPGESRPPYGHFRVGTWVETELVQPFLETAVTARGEYVTNSKGFETAVETTSSSLKLRGSTDPVVTTRDGTIVLPTEVKTVRSYSSRALPRETHRAQLHAYLYALDRTTDASIAAGVLIYVARDTLELRSFVESFDESFWQDRVVPWMRAHRRYRTKPGLPPATPERPQECEWCEFRHRCGKTSLPVEDLASTGFVPTHRYPRASVEFHLQRPDVSLTPTLADTFPDLAASNPVADWVCAACGERVAYGDDRLDRDADDPPSCPSCGSRGDFGQLAGPKPDRLQVVDG
ncbi:MAG: PD-(D/E)XK nuclease family protein [Halodesulfurarchaeum sp.]